MFVVVVGLICGEDSPTSAKNVICAVTLANKESSLVCKSSTPSFACTFRMLHCQKRLNKNLHPSHTAHPLFNKLKLHVGNWMQVVTSALAGEEVSKFLLPLLTEVV